jgi:hypothetical protein
MNIPPKPPPRLLERLSLELPDADTATEARKGQNGEADEEDEIAHEHHDDPYLEGESGEP